MAGNFEFSHLLRTKLYRPRATGELVHRTRVCDLLERFVDLAVTLVCAPAGFGKTTLLVDWLDHSPYPSAWISLDSADNDVAVFVSYFVAAVRTQFPDACAATLSMLAAAVLPPQSALVTSLSNDLEELASEASMADGKRLVLVLDDYHLVTEPAVHALLGELLVHPPRTLHLVISTRQDPPFPLHALRGRGNLGEVRGQQLRFTPDEVEAFMQQALQTPADPQFIGRLSELSEGWGTGLRLAALAINAGAEVTDTDTSTDNFFALEYLLNEALAHVPVPTQDFLIKTSILNRLCGPLCDAVAGRSGDGWDGSAYLAWLAAQNLFTFSLDALGTWYRYHHLFQKLLRRQLERRHDSQEIADLHRRASEWYAEKGLIEEAIEHAMATGDAMAAVRLVESHRHEAMNQERWRQLEHWLRMLPPELADTRPELLMLQAWLLEQQWRALDIPPLLDRVESMLDQVALPNRARLRSEVVTLRGWVCYYTFDAECAVTMTNEAIATVPAECSLVRAFAWFYMAAARQMMGDLKSALEAFHTALNEDRLHGNAYPSRLYSGLCFAHWMAADLPNLLLAANQLLQMARQRDLPEGLGWAHYFRGCVLYEMNDLTGAELEFGAAVARRYIAHSLAFSHAAFGLAAVYMAQGEHDRAREIAASVAAYAVETNNERIAADAEAFRALIAAETGSPAQAQRWVDTQDISRPLVPMTTFHVARVAHARVLLSLRTPAALAEAEKVLAGLHDRASVNRNTLVLIEVLALQAMLEATRGDLATAHARLKQALNLAEPGGLIRVFVDLGPDMAALLRQLAAKGVAPLYVPRLLAAFGDTKKVPVAPPPGSDGLAVPLSHRELEVLDLLGGWMTNKEIARELSISPTTVKRHTVNIYQKLDVDNRRAAVAKAEALGLAVPPKPSRIKGASR